MASTRLSLKINQGSIIMSLHKKIIKPPPPKAGEGGSQCCQTTHEAEGWRKATCCGDAAVRGPGHAGAWWALIGSMGFIAPSLLSPGNTSFHPKTCTLFFLGFCRRITWHAETMGSSSWGCGPFPCPPALGPHLGW